MTDKPKDKAVLAVEAHNHLRDVCLKNAKSLLKAASLLLNRETDHVAFHTTKLALEEIGKIQIHALGVTAMNDTRNKEPSLSFATDDHERKLFFAIWGSSFGKVKMTKEQIDDSKTVAKNIHKRSLDYLYVADDNPKEWHEKMEKGEAERLFKCAEARLKYEEAAHGGMRTDMSEEETAELKWFMDIQEDPERRKEIWGHKSQDKLVELGDVKAWIKWLKATYESNEAEMRALLKRELEQKPVKGVEGEKQKWRIKVNVVTPSHSLKKKPMTDLNASSHRLKMHYIDNHSMNLEILLPKSVPVAAVWDNGWGIVRNFIVAMNIATKGLFWWNIKKDPARYYEEIWDLETNSGVNIEINPRLQINWQDARLTYKDTEISLTFLVFNFILEKWIPGADCYLNDYATAMSIYAKNDIHLRVESTAFVHFFNALKRAMLENGDWDGVSDFTEAYYAKTSEFFSTSDTSEKKRYFELGFELDADHNSKKLITITDVQAMKVYFDVYLLGVVKKHEEEKTGVSMRFVMATKDGSDVKDAEVSKSNNPDTPVTNPDPDPLGCPTLK